MSDTTARYGLDVTASLGNLMAGPGNHVFLPLTATQPVDTIRAEAESGMP